MSNLGTAEVDFDAADEASRKIKAELENMVEQMTKAKNALNVLQETNNQQVVQTIASGYERLSNILNESPGLAEHASQAIANYKEAYYARIDNQRLAEAIYEA